MRCRICSGDEFEAVLDLGEQPLANSLVLPADVDREEARYPLALALCRACGLVQLTHVVSGETMFRDYLYFSSVSHAMTKHFAAYADDVARRFVPEGGLVVEMGSNDGVLLRSLLGRPLRVLGVDPARNLAEVARRSGVPTIAEFFCEPVATSIRKDHGPASVVIANNVFAHIDDLDSVMRGIDALLTPEGVFVIEAPYLVDLVEHVEFDTVYHEHLSYFSLRPLIRLFGRFGFEVFDVERRPVHGGSIRVFAKRAFARHAAASPTAAVAAALAVEDAAGVSDPARLAQFAERVAGIRTDLTELVERLRAGGKRIAAFGASAKGTVLLNYCGLGRSSLEFIVDDTPAKQGLLAPGSKLPIRPAHALSSERIDYALLLAWNHAREIMERQSGYRDRGGRFIIPVPRPEIV